MQMKTIRVLLILILIICFSNITFAASTTSYSFRVLNSPDQRQVAFNIASKQHEMSLEEDKIAQFKSLIEGRIMSIISSDIVEKMIAEEGFGGGAEYDTDSLDIYVEEINGQVIVTIINKESGEKDELIYNPDDWPDLSGL